MKKDWEIYAEDGYRSAYVARARALRGAIHYAEAHPGVRVAVRGFDYQEAEMRLYTVARTGR